MSADAQFLKRLAPRDLVSSLALVIGYRDAVYRRKAVNALRLSAGDLVVEIGCGTGRNFPLLEHAIGAEGRIIGIDASAEMIARANHRAVRHGWTNIELHQTDAAHYQFPEAISGAVSTYTLVAIAEYDVIIERVFHALKPGGRCAVLDQKLPSGAAALLTPLIDFWSRPLEYSRIVRERRVWESIERHAGNVQLEDFYFGWTYLAVGQKSAVAAIA